MGRDLRLKVFNDINTMSRATLRLLPLYVPGFRRALMLMIAVFLARSYMAGNIVPTTIASFVNAIKFFDIESIKKGVATFAFVGMTYLVTEFSLFRYFSKLVEGIVKLKEKMLKTLTSSGPPKGIPPEDLVGRIGSDVDYIVWNLNGFLTTLIPNLATAITAIATIIMFNTKIGVIALFTLLPYITIVEYYSRRVELARSKEREVYSMSITYIRDIIYGTRSSDAISKILVAWKNVMNRIMLYDRVFWGLGLLTQFISTSLIAYITFTQVSSNSIDEGIAAGILSATLTAHTSFVNAVWGLCIQSQTVPAVRRIVEYLSNYVEKDQKEQLRLVITRSR